MKVNLFYRIARNKIDDLEVFPNVTINSQNYWPGPANYQSLFETATYSLRFLPGSDGC